MGNREAVVSNARSKYDLLHTEMAGRLGDWEDEVRALKCCGGKDW